MVLRSIALLALVMLALLATSAARAEGVVQPPPGHYLFVEAWVDVEAQGHLPRLCIDFPTYSYDAATGVLRPYFSGQPPFHLPAEAWGFRGLGESRWG